MLDLMYEAPSRNDIKVCHITSEAVEKRSGTLAMLRHSDSKKAKPHGETA